MDVNQGMGSHLSPQEDNQGSWKYVYGNQGQNYGYSSFWEEQEKIGNMESNNEVVLEGVLEKVISKDLRVRELKHDILYLTQMVESHSISIKQFEDRLNRLTSKMKSGVDMELIGAFLEGSTMKFGNNLCKITDKVDTKVKVNQYNERKPMVQCEENAP